VLDSHQGNHIQLTSGAELAQKAICDPKDKNNNVNNIIIFLNIFLY
jgi:hypothetical protein